MNYEFVSFVTSQTEDSKNYIQSGSVCAAFTGAVYRVNYFKPLKNNQDSSIV